MSSTEKRSSRRHAGTRRKTRGTSRGTEKNTARNFGDTTAVIERVDERRKSPFEWGVFLATIGVVALFAAAGFFWGLAVGVEFF